LARPLRLALTASKTSADRRPGRRQLPAHAVRVVVRFGLGVFRLRARSDLLQQLLRQRHHLVAACRLHGAAVHRRGGALFGLGHAGRVAAALARRPRSPDYPSLRRTPSFWGPTASTRRRTRWCRGAIS
jgi:hypothetical protein